MNEWARYLRIAIYVGLFATPFLALLVMNGFFFPYITGKNFGFRIITEIVFGLWLVLAFMEPQVRPQKSLALILGGLFVLAIGVSTALAENPFKAFWSNFERMEGYITILHLAMYTLVMTSVMQGEKIWRYFINTSLIAATLVGLYGLSQLIGSISTGQSEMRIDATLGNATYFAVFMLVHAFLAIYAYFKFGKGSRLMMAAYGVPLLLFVVMVFNSLTRGSILSLLGGLLLAGLIFAFSRGAGTLRTVGIGLVGVIIVFSGIFFAVKDSDFVHSTPILARLATISLEAGSTRFAIWHMAYQGFVERPIFGWGQEGFNYVFNKYYEPGLYAQEPWFDRAHNVGLDWLVAGGLVGALLYLSLYIVLLYYLWRPSNTFDVAERAILTGLLAGYAFHNIFVFDNLMSYLMFMAIFSYITVRAVPPKGWGTPLTATSFNVGASVTAVVTVAVIYFVNAPGIATTTDIIKGLSPQTAGVTKNMEYLVAANNRGGLGSQEAAEQFLQFAIQVQQLKVGDQAFQLQAATAARDAALKEIARAPEDARLQVFIGSFLRQFGDYAGSEEHLTKALELSPKKQLIKFELGTLYLAANKPDLALAILKDAYESEPKYEQALTTYAGVAILTGQSDVASKLLIDHYGTDTPNQLNILQAYLQAKNYPKALAIARERVAKAPQNAIYWQQLAGVLIEVEDKAGAIEALTKAIEFDPSFKTQGESFIAQIQAGTL